MNKKTNSGLKIICLNRKASFNYFFEDLLEAGIVLKGSEIIIKIRDNGTGIPENIRNKHVRYILSCQNPDGGFYGRDPDSDLYYTGFALRSLLVLNALDTPTCEKVGTFLSQRLHSQTSLVDFFSLVYSAVIVSMGGGPDVFPLVEIGLIP
mgnify:CR=1 FL=1